MVEKNSKDGNPEKRYLITQGELPVSAGGGKSTTKEKLIFSAIAIVVVLIVIYLVI